MQEKYDKTGICSDNTWKCGCGALNAVYRETCGRCGNHKPKNK